MGHSAKLAIINPVKFQSGWNNEIENNNKMSG